MPTYEYKRADGTTFEVRQGINDDPLTECPETGQAVSRVISGGGGVVYKGSGFYVTDYKNSGPSASESAQGSSGCAGGACGCASHTAPSKAGADS